MERGSKVHTVDIEVIKNDLETKIGLLEMKINNGEIKEEDSVLELIALFKEYEKTGTTLEELQLLYSDVQLALK